ncbi:MAG: cytochrome c [Dongiaceae bacterium]
MLTRTKALLGGVLALAVGFTVLASAVADDPAAVISQRRDLMKDQGKNAKAIYQFTQGQGTAADVAAAAQAIAADATKIPDLFPKGTSLDEFPGKTGAKPAIWQDWDKFKADAAALHEQATKLAEVAKGGDAQAIAAQFDVMGKTGCGGCHQSFRQKLE